MAINWVLQRPSVANVIIGARTEEQLRENLGAVGWALTARRSPCWMRPAPQRPPIPTGISRASPSATRRRCEVAPSNADAGVRECHPPSIAGNIADLLIALWDGQPAQGEGSTGALVAAARERRLPIAWIKTHNYKPGYAQPLMVAPQGAVILENF